MTGPSRRFDPSELRTPGAADPSAAELADALGAARDLEALAASEGIRPTEGFDDRVMAAIALEPIPRAVVTGGNVARGTAAGAFLYAVRNAWRVGSTGGRPFAVRAQALAFVFVVVLAAGSLAGAGVITVAGLFKGNNGPAPTPQAVPTALPTPIQATPSPSPSVEPTETAQPTETAEPTETPDPGQTVRPTRTPRPTQTPSGTDDHGGGGGPGPDGGGSGGGGGGGGPGPDGTSAPDGSGGGPGPG
jgi:uncharacterized membrane protein YgcG